MKSPKLFYVIHSEDLVTEAEAKRDAAYDIEYNDMILMKADKVLRNKKSKVTLNLPVVEI